MSALQIIAIILGIGITIVGWGLLARAVKHFLTVFKLGRPEYGRRTNEGGARTATLLREFLGHGRMARLPVVAIAHWITMISFGILFLTLVQATFQLFDPHFALPLIGHFVPYEWITELFAMTGIISIVVLMAIRLKNHPRSAAGEDGRRSRFFGSTFWQAYYVEYTILGVGICIALLRGMEYSLMRQTGEAEYATMLHFPLTGWIGELFSGMSVEALEAGIILVALAKLLISYAWMITISITPTMGVAWHRFLAFFNIWFKRHPDGRTSLAELAPMEVDGKPFSMEVMEEMDEDTTLGVGKVEDFTWKGLLDFSTCTECGRCQSQCPAWNTDKPLSPKMLMMTLRDHAHSKAPFLAAAEGRSGVISPGGARSQTASGPVALADQQGAPEGGVAVAEPDVINWGEMSLIGQTGYSQENPLEAYNPHGPDAVVDEDVLWACTTCGACVEQCPVDIEHVDHIVDMRRYQTLIESAFPSELGGLFKNMESKGNPWGMGAKARLEWAKDLPFKVKVLGDDVESAEDVDYLFWVGCAGAYEDRAKKTSRAVAELLDHAGVDFAVLGNGETCTGDSARRAGNEVLFQMLAEQNVETLNEVGATKIVVTCAHCFNTIKNEYPQLGGKYEVVHHTQLLNRLVREKRITPVNRPDGPRKSTSKDVASSGPSVTYHDPCYLGRHNNVYAPPRELISALPGVELKEMERSKEKSFCCGAGGARMWMEEKLGSRINLNRTEEAIATGADRIAIGCPFCRVMLSDGLTAKQSEGASEDIEVVDVAQMLLASVKEAQATGGTTESQEQAESEPKTAVPAPAEGKDAKGATPAAPSEAETAKTAAAVQEAGEDPDAVAGKETVADQNSAPSWETGAAVGGAAAVGAGAAAAAASSDDEPSAAEPQSAAEKNAAPSWEDNAAPSWETGGGAGAATTPAAEPETPTEPQSAAEKNAAPSWEDNAAPSWETGGGAGAATTPAAEPETPAEQPTPAEPPTASDDSVAAQNAAPSWETSAVAGGAVAGGAAVAGAAAATSDEGSTDAPAAEASPEPQISGAPADAAPAATDGDLAAQNAAPSWESGATPAATPAPTPEPEATTDSASEPQDAATSTDEANPSAGPEAVAGSATAGSATAGSAPSAPAAADGDLAAHNAAPSWESGTAPAAAAPAASEASAPAESSETPATEQAASPETPEGSTEAPADEAVAPATEPGETSPIEPTQPTGAEATEAPATEQPAQPTDGGEAPEQSGTAPSAPASSGTTDPDLLSELAKKNAKPDWE